MKFASTQKLIFDFQGTFRGHGDRIAVHRLERRIGEVLRYYYFLERISERFDVASARFGHTLDELLKEIPKTQGEHSSTAKESDLHDQLRDCSIVVQMEIESFYLFLKIALDHIAELHRLYFGWVWEKDRTYSVHRKLLRRLEKGPTVEGLIPPTDQHLQLMKELSRVVTYRDKLIEHNSYDLLLRPYSWSDNDGVQIRPSVLFPQINDEARRAQKQLETLVSENPSSLLSELDTYIDLTIQFFASNRQHSILSSNTSQAIPHQAVEQ